MRCWLAALCLMLALVQAYPQGDTLEVPLAKGWGASPGWTPNDAAAKYDLGFKDGAAFMRASGGGGTMIWVTYPQPRLDVKRMQYVTMRYRLTNTDASLGSYLLYLDTGDSGGMYARNLIFGANDLIHDGQWHTATTTLYPFGEIGAIALRFRALEGKEGRLDVAYLRFSALPPRNALREVLDWQPGHIGLATQDVPLGSLRRAALPETQAALDLKDWFTSEKITVAGVGFEVPLTGPAALATSVEKKERVTVPVGKRAQALYLLMGAKFPYKMLGYEGWVPGDMTERPEQFEVTIRYADGSAEEQVPYCLSKGQYGVWRGLQAYGLPVMTGKEVKEIELSDGMLTSSFHLVAVSAADKSLVPATPDAPLRTPLGAAPTQAQPAVEVRGDIVTVRNATGQLRFSLGARGLTVTDLRNGLNPACDLNAGPSPLFSLKEKDKLWTSADFTLAKPVAVSGAKAQLSLTCAEAKASVDLSVEATPTETRLGLQLKNHADHPRTLDLTFPEVRLRAGQPADLWYFYPSMCPAWSNADHTYEQPYSGYLPVQFMDTYDRRNGGGLYLGTRDQTLRQRYYRLAKEGSEVKAGIVYRWNPPLAAGETVTYPETVIALHGGDWKPALAAYETWFKSWYKPARPRLDWYRKVWNFRTYWTHTMGNGKPEWNIFNLKTGEYQTEQFYKKDRELYGQVDMAHFFDWRISRQYGAYGDFSHYEDIGGLDKFRAMIRDLQGRGVRVGLYLDCYLCSKKSLIGRQHGNEWALVGQDGRLGDGYSTAEDPMYNMCVLHPGWQDYLAQTCARVARETGCDGIYLDEGMTDLENYWCFSKDHGHPVPGVNQPGLLELARKVRAALPQGVALYTEWSPADAIIPQLDGAYQASLRFSDSHLTPGNVQLARFVFPDFKVFSISNGGSMYDGIWEGTKYNLFSGVPLYTLSWGHDEEAYPLIRKMSTILHEHQDAFLAPNPRPFVDTERAEVFCNEFPGERETVWTFWNGRYRTVTGPVLKARHVPGARYLDLWNGKDLTPVIEGSQAIITTTLGPRGIGAVAQLR